VVGTHRLEEKALGLEDAGLDSQVLAGPTQTVWMLVNSRIP
jgi:hypothetical protein